MRVLRVSKCRVIAITIVVFCLFPSLVSPRVGQPLPVPVSQPTPHTGVPRTQLSSDWARTTAGPYVVVELHNGSVQCRGEAVAAALRSYGLEVVVTDQTAVLTGETDLFCAEGIVLDASLGSDKGQAADEALLELLVRVDRPVVALGRAAWLLHRLRGLSPPSQTAPVYYTLATTPRYSGAVFLEGPVQLTMGALLSTEDTVQLPCDRVQTAHSRLVDLVCGEPPALAPVRYDSWPLDLFLFGPEDPNSLTDDGLGLLVNVIAYSTALHEDAVTGRVVDSQPPAPTAVPGGMSYWHQPFLRSLYHGVHVARALLSGDNWSVWRDDHVPLVRAYLQSVYDTGPDGTAFAPVEDGTPSNTSTAQGLWLTVVMGLEADFDVDALVAYLSARQDPDGGYEDDLTVTYYVTEALGEAHRLGAIDTAALKSWLRACVVDGTQTTKPEQSVYWGAVSKNPDSLDARNTYAEQYLVSLSYLNTTHNDPVKLTEWLQDNARGDGSYQNRIEPSSEDTVGTAAALSAMSIMGTLPPENLTAGLAWFADSQCVSGGFGIVASDGVGKMAESAAVARCLSVVGESSSAVADGIVQFLRTCESPVALEVMEPIPSTMWGYWMSRMGRMAHAVSEMNTTALHEYLAQFGDWRVYPANITYVASPEYYIDQYGTRSVWTNLFGTGMSLAAGHELTDAQVSAVRTYVSRRQHYSGHFRLCTYPVAPHMQYTVAAVEALFMIDSLDWVQHRSALDSAVMAEYLGGHWSTEGWTLRPFAGHQPAVDFLSTRTALRLGLVTASMASEISANISARIQYNDLWDLSMDVQTLALLNESGFSVSLEAIDRDMVLQALGDRPFSDGWYNSTILWQPVFTADVLTMVSVLGLRPEIREVTGSSMTAEAVGTATLGGTIDVEVNITAPTGNHTLRAYLFGDCYELRGVSGQQTVSLDIPNNPEHLGWTRLALMVVDWGASRSFSEVRFEVRSSLNGTLSVATSSVLVGDPINGTVDWTLATGSDAGLTNVTVRLGDPPNYVEYHYREYSPFEFSVPTTGLSAGIYNLTVTLTRNHCDQCVLRQPVTIVKPVPVHFEADDHITADLGPHLVIPWSLLFDENGSYVVGQLVTLHVCDQSGALVFNDTAVSAGHGQHFIWTPQTRGRFNYTLRTEKNGTMLGTETSGTIDVYEATALTWLDNGTLDQYSQVTQTVRLTGHGGAPIAGQYVHVVVVAPSGTTVVDDTVQTNGTGMACVTFVMQENGQYNLSAEHAATGHLLASSAHASSVAWDQASVSIGGTPAEGLVTDSWSVWAKVSDSHGVPVVGAPVTLRIVYLPDTTVVEELLLTNSSGMVSYAWSTASPGKYSLTAQYAGSVSRGGASAATETTLWVPVTLTVEASQQPHVGTPGWIRVTVTDHTGNPIEGLTLAVTVTAPDEVVLLDHTGSTDHNGTLIVVWTPSARGINTVNATSARQDWFERATSSLDTGVTEDISLTVAWSPDVRAPAEDTLVLTMTDTSHRPAASVVVDTRVLLDGTAIFNATNTTGPDGRIIYSVYVPHPGLLTVSYTVAPQGWFTGTTGSEKATAMGTTTLTLSLDGYPVWQGKTVPIVTTLKDWRGAPLSGLPIVITITRNGTAVRSELLHTSADGTCVITHRFDVVGDFLVNASFEGSGLNASAVATVVQRVRCQPVIMLDHALTATVGSETAFRVSLHDMLGAPVPKRTLVLTVQMDGTTVFKAMFTSSNSTDTVYWLPSRRGTAHVSVVHMGDDHYLDASNSSTMSVMEVGSGTITVSADPVDLFDSVSICYNLSVASDRQGVVVLFQVLGQDLVPIWTTTVATDENGTATVTYHANQTHGLLTVRAAPVPEEFLLGCGTEGELTVMTDCIVHTTVRPETPVMGSPLVLTVHASSELGAPLSGLTVTVHVTDPNGNTVLFGALPYARVQVEDGTGTVSFTPDTFGLYRVHIESQGSTAVHPCSSDSSHTVFVATQLDLLSSPVEIELGDPLLFVTKLRTQTGEVLAGMEVRVGVSGPATVGPVTLVTNATGHIEWSTVLSAAGSWTVTAEFGGAGVYLPATLTVEVHVRISTVLSVTVVSTGQLVAGRSPVVLEVLLTDASGHTLEGRTVSYRAFHEVSGVVASGTLTQYGEGPQRLNVTLHAMGNYTLVFRFNRTEHYYASTASVTVFVVGTTSLEVYGPSTLDRASNSAIVVRVVDELGMVVPPETCSMDISLVGPTGPVMLADRLSYNASCTHLALHGLPTGSYHLEVSVTAPDRLGSNTSWAFEVTAHTSIVVVDSTLPGTIAVAHSIDVTVVDSLGAVVSPVSLRACVVAPDGSYVIGGLLSGWASIDSASGVASFEWTPQQAGNYSVLVSFDGDDHLSNASLSLVCLVRYATQVAVSPPTNTTYPEPLVLHTTLTSGVQKIRGATLSVEVVSNVTGSTVTSLTVVTDMSGTALVDVGPLLAGVYQFHISFRGNDIYAPSSAQCQVVVVPTASVSLREATLVVGQEGTLSLAVEVAGVPEVWNGTATIVIVSDNGTTVYRGEVPVNASCVVTLSLRLDATGTYGLHVTLHGLPAGASVARSFSIVVSVPPPVLPLSAESTPVIGGTVIVTLAGLVLRRRLSVLTGSLPAEWPDEQQAQQQ